MLEYPNGGRLVQAASELPELGETRSLYLDFETTSGDPAKKSLNPWKDCSLLGAAVTLDDEPRAWYIPMRHHDSRWNVPLEAALRWLQAALDGSVEWVNHNVKYDAQAAWCGGLRFDRTLLDTVTASKVLDSDRVTRGGYGLDALSAAWLEHDISGYEARLQPYLGRWNKDYGAIPADILGEYACQDVLTARRLRLYVERRMPDECRPVWAEETRLTAALADMERIGMRIDPQELAIRELQLTSQLLKIEETLHEVVGMPMRPHVNDDCFEVLCVRYGLPVLGYTDTVDPETNEHNPSFDKGTLASYLRYPLVASDPTLTRAVKLMLQYRKLNTLLSLFVRKYRELEVDGVLHPTYNQSVRTGRLSCSDPNAQQLSKGDDGAKVLIHPTPGYAFLSADYSQVEFRIIVHYIRDAAATAAYAADPDTDFHQWVADVCGVPRRPAKNINFAMAFGGGKKRVLSMLEANMELVGNLMATAEQLATREGGEPITWFHALARQRAEEVFNTYHGKLPGIKRMSRVAANKLRSRGYVRNAYGRYRRLPTKAAFRAFNSVIQSTAADVMKERFNATAPRYCDELRGWGVRQVATVHDEVLFEAPVEMARDPRLHGYLARELERIRVELRVPMRVSIGVSDRSWAAAAADAAVVPIDRSLPPPGG